MTEMLPISSRIWDMKYRLKAADGTPVDGTIEDTWRRVARALAMPEPEPERWEPAFYEALEGFKFLPAGRILAGAGAERQVTLFNCFVMGRIGDDMSAIFQHLKEAALTMQQGGGIGYDFSTLRPKGAPVKGVGADASGPLPFMDVWDAMCRTIMSAGFRRGAMMGCLRCDHPDIEAFIEAKRDPGRLRMFNLSVLVTDAFMQAVKDNAPWELAFEGVVYRTVQARALWERIIRSTYAYAEPGVIFIDRINRANNLAYCEEIFATNPCGEQPLPPYGACLLGSINLASLVRNPFERDAALDMAALETLTATAVRMLDNAIDCSRFPIAAQQEEAQAKRRIGLGVTGLADALIMCRARYGSDAANGLIAGGWAACSGRRIWRLPGWLRRRAPSPSTTPRAMPKARQSRASTMTCGRRSAHRGSATRCSPRWRRPARSRCWRATSPPASSRCSATPTRATCSCRTARAGRKPWTTTPICCSAASRAIRRRCPTISSMPSRSARPITSPFRRRPRPSSTVPSPRPSTARRRWRSTTSRTSTCGPTTSAARDAPPTGPTP